MFSVDVNYTRVSEFVIVGFPSLQPEHFDLVAWFFFFLYVTTLVGNLLLVVLFALEQNLQKPMYIVMVSLALSDIGQYVNDCVELPYILYSMVMTNQTMLGLTLFCWVVAHIFSGISTFHFTMMPFCGPNQIVHAFCDTMSVMALVCGDTSKQFRDAFAGAMFILYVPLALIVISYICIIISALNMATGQGRMKTFSTCATRAASFPSTTYHFFVYSTPYFPNLIMTPDKRIATALFYSLFPPLINPFIYCLRTKELKLILKRWVQRRKKHYAYEAWPNCGCHQVILTRALKVQFVGFSGI
ncbi:Olfactory receptor 2A5 Olfactory receptor 2A26 [Larimichthys crocea]|uniref:Olfactory receptor 2A5 Olfactory receptor 2A26 n=1 Tax=Larimichthys crocea TaxID=215358 RepID=A0A6G0I7S2_LARCR|nr:Olfactory receptor 2A5 Olfactory receptor 2A26 [Larimichthys crocea]